MSLVDYLVANRAPMELAKELAATAKENVALRDKVHALEHELFWTKVDMENKKKANHQSNDVAPVEHAIVNGMKCDGAGVWCGSPGCCPKDDKTAAHAVISAETNNKEVR